MSDLYSEVIHEWFHERFPDPDTGAYLNWDSVITIVQEPNLKIFYREEVVHLCCWFTYGGVSPAEFRVLYADPQMFDKLERVLEMFKTMEQESVKSFGQCRWIYGLIVLAN